MTLRNMDGINGEGNVVIVENIEDFDASQHEAGEPKCVTLQGKYYKQTYRKAWENLPDFKGWLQGVNGEPTRAFCSFCQVTLFAHRLSLLKHTCTLKHQKAAQKVWLLESLKSNGAISNEEPMSSQSDQTAVSVSILQDGTEDQEKLDVGENIVEDSLLTSPSQIKSMDCVYLVPVDNMDLNLQKSPPVSVAVQEEVQLYSIDSSPSVTIGIQEKVQTLAVESSVAKSPEQIMAHSPMYPLSTHVLDTTKGQPVGGLQVSLYRLIDGRWTLVNEGMTSHDGRCNQLIQKANFVAGRYKLHFDTDRYFELQRKETLYPFVEIAFDVHAPEEHYHIPLLLSAFGYTTYRGS